MKSIKQLLDIMSDLRNPETGCPWDIKQTFKSVVPYTLEEAYEVADSIEKGAMDELKDELGDLLFQVVFYAQMAKEKKLFEFDDVVASINHKLVRRHPHVFAGTAYESDEELNDAWENAKSQERDVRGVLEKVSALDGVAQALPALKRSQKLQKRAARVGFDWPDIAPVFDKIQQEIVEVKQAAQSANQAHLTEEIGDLLFSCVNLARHFDVDAEEALRSGNKKFEKRFHYIEEILQRDEKVVQTCSLEELETLWQQAKKSL